MLYVQNSPNSVSFCGLKELLRGSKKELTKEDKLLELNRGMMSGLDAKKRGIEVCREIIIRETLSGNFDFVEGFNKIIGKDMARKVYNSIPKK